VEARASAKVDVIATTKDEKSFHLPRESLLLAYRASSSLNVRLLGSCGLLSGASLVVLCQQSERLPPRKLFWPRVQKETGCSCYNGNLD
jgi:hypothetical protein